jgi:hypothetical protein
VSGEGEPLSTGGTGGTGGPDGSAGAGGPDGSAGAGHWYQRRALVWSVVVVVVIGVAVISDLPQHQSRQSQISGGTSVMKQINSDLAPCSYAVNEAFEIEADVIANSLSSANRARVPGYLRDDQDACAFTNSSINDLANLEVPGTNAGKELGDLVSTVTFWASSDALAAIESIQTLTSKPGNVTAGTDLATAERLMASDRAEAENQEAAANRILGTHLPALQLPELAPLPDPH